MEKLKKTYLFLAYLTFNCLVTFVLLNAILGIAFFARDRMTNPGGVDERVRGYREKFVDYDAYTRTTRADVTALLDEYDAMGTAGLQYKPWVQFRNPTVKGRLLNTDENGFRATAKPEGRPARPVKVYVFGGSTTFGYGVADKDTIPSYLQASLEHRYPNMAFVVRNFGQAYYYSTQEQALLLEMLRDGDVPDWAVFIDGGNDTAQLALKHDEPIFSPALSRVWNQSAGEMPSATFAPVSRLPVGRLISGLRKRILKNSHEVSSQHTLIMNDTQLSDKERREIIDYVVKHYSNNLRITRAVTREFGVDALFVWQPHPSYKYDRQLHKRFPFDGPVPGYLIGVFERMERYQEPNFLFLGGLTERPEKSYVDDVHYNEVVNEQIAKQIAKLIQVDAKRQE